VTPLGARRLAAYMRETADGLAAQGTAALTSAKFKFPDPLSIKTSELQER
jgi:hypothetical protein